MCKKELSEKGSVRHRVIDSKKFQSSEAAFPTYQLICNALLAETCNTTPKAASMTYRLANVKNIQDCAELMKFV